MTGNRKSYHALIEEGQGLVMSLASRIHRSIPVRLDLDDLIAYGEVGLAEAAQKFDPGQGCQFTTFAYYRVRGAIYDGISKMSWTSRAQYRRFRFQQLANETLAEDAADQPIPEHPRLPDEARWFRRVTEKLAVIYLASQETEGDAAGADFQDPRDSAAAVVAQREISERLHQLVNALPNLEAKLIETVYFEGASLQQAADHLGISKSWASRLHARALEQLARDLARINAADLPRARTR
jgi:RNA polymerase sigma factor for flagellar operon FliA